MTQTIEAVFEDGVFRPVDPPHFTLVKGQRVRLQLETDEPERNPLTLLMHVLDGLSEEEKDEVEKEILNRRPLFGDRSSI